MRLGIEVVVRHCLKGKNHGRWKIKDGKIKNKNIWGHMRL